jgi:hypothetical protein
LFASGLLPRKFLYSGFPHDPGHIVLFVFFRRKSFWHANHQNFPDTCQRIPPSPHSSGDSDIHMVPVRIFPNHTPEMELILLHGLGIE